MLEPLPETLRVYRYQVRQARDEGVVLRTNDISAAARALAPGLEILDTQEQRVSRDGVRWQAAGKVPGEPPPSEAVEIESEALAMIEMFLRMCDDPEGVVLREGWEADPDSMGYCLNEVRTWISVRRQEARTPPRLCRPPSDVAGAEPPTLPCAACGSAAALTASQCAQCDADQSTETIECGECDGEGTVERQDLRPTPWGAVPSTEPWATHSEACECGNGRVEAPFLEERRAAIAAVTALSPDYREAVRLLRDAGFLLHEIRRTASFSAIGSLLTTVHLRQEDIAAFLARELDRRVTASEMPVERDPLPGMVRA